jgi:predicted nucleic acid-binding Zn ribbon protein
MNNEEGICPVCHQAVLSDYYFCPNCGHNLKEKPVEITTMIQIGLYALAIFLPPLGLWPGIKYLMKKDPEAKKIGGIVVILTLISTFLTIWWIFKLLGNYLEIINGMLY